MTVESPLADAELYAHHTNRTTVGFHENVSRALFRTTDGVKSGWVCRDCGKRAVEPWGFTQTKCRNGGGGA